MCGQHQVEPLGRQQMHRLPAGERGTIRPNRPPMARKITPTTALARISFSACDSIFRPVIGQ
jgi:hypothetical protein